MTSDSLDATSQFATAEPPLLRIYRRVMLILLARLPTGRMLRAVAPLRNLYGRQVLARQDHTGLHWGSFDSYESALAAVPPSRRAGWDNEVAAKFWVDSIAPVSASTYPVLFWLRTVLQKNSSVVDLGGSIGLTYYGYRRYAEFPEGLRWTVVEVPKIAQQGRVVAERENARALQFCHDLTETPPCDVFLCAGALQYLREPVEELLQRLKSRPRFIILNKLPITSAGESWTLQNYGPAVAPMRLFNRESFVAAFAAAGYRLVDRWDVENLDCLIPFYPERFVRTFTGFTFERIDEPGREPTTA